MSKLDIILLVLGGLCLINAIWFFIHRTKYDGEIIVIKSDEKLLYSLELEDLPENLQYKKRAIFRVVPPDPES